MKKGRFVSLGCYGGRQRYMIYFDIVPLEKLAHVILMSRAWSSPRTFPSFLALFLALGTCPRHLRSEAGPLSPRERHIQGATGLLRALGDIFHLELFVGGEKCRFGDSRIFVFTGVGFACVLHDASKSSLPPPQMRCFMARVSEQESLLKSEIIHGFEIPFQHVKLYQSCAWVRRTYLFIYCYTSVKYFVELKAEAFWFFYLPKSSTTPFWFNFPLFFRTDNSVTPCSPEATWRVCFLLKDS